MRNPTALIALTLLVTSCSSVENIDSVDVGGYLDEHGCLPSGGYEWSTLQEKCMRLWEQETISLSPTTGDDTGSIEILFSDDREAAEIFLIGGDNIIVKRTAEGIWRGSGGDFRLEKKGDGPLQLFSEGRLIAAEELLVVE